jgi:uncharacterized membrane protein
MKIVNKVRLFLFVVIVVAAIVSPLYTVGQTQEKDLIIRFSPGSYPYNVKIGQDNIFYLEVENTGTQAITNIRLYANTPEGWVIEIKPKTISYLAAGSMQTIDANVKPVATASKRGYQIAFVAEGDGIRRVMTIRVKVEDSSSLWLWVGVGIGVIVITGFILVFLRMGRQ